MACHGLPPRQGLLGITLAAGLTMVPCIAFAGIIAWLMLLPYVKLVAGVGLLYIGIKVLLSGGPEQQAASAMRFWGVVRIAAASNFIVSLDNVIATAAAAQGNPALLLTGILVTVPATVVGAAFIDRLIDLIPALAWAGSGLLGWIAGETTASDSSIERHLSAGQAQPVELLAAASCAVLVVSVGAIWRRVGSGRRRRPIA
jgi:predicted tellurium resistance membrane protein TerC